MWDQNDQNKEMIVKWTILGIVSIVVYFDRFGPSQLYE